MPQIDKSIRLIGFPMDLGAGRRGVDMGPSALRIAGMVHRIQALGYEVVDEGDIQVQTRELQDFADERLRYLPEISRASQQLADRTLEVLETGDFPLILGGDHSMSIGTLGGVGAYCRKAGKRLGVIWIDAHADMNVPATTPSGNIHGMPLAVSLGHGDEGLCSIGGAFPKVKPENVAVIAARSVDPGERELIKKLALPTYTMFEIDRDGIYKIITLVLDRMRSQVDHIHVSFDLDSVDPSVAKGVGTPVSGGLTFRETHLIMEAIAETGMLGSLEIAEVNPILDDMNNSAQFAVGCVTSCLGKRII